MKPATYTFVYWALDRKPPLPRVGMTAGSHKKFPLNFTSARDEFTGKFATKFNPSEGIRSQEN